MDEELERPACAGEGKEGQSLLQCPACPVCSQSGQGPGAGLHSAGLEVLVPEEGVPRRPRRNPTELEAKTSP